MGCCSPDIITQTDLQRVHLEASFLSIFFCFGNCHQIDSRSNKLLLSYWHTYIYIFFLHTTHTTLLGLYITYNLVSCSTGLIITVGFFFFYSYPNVHRLYNKTCNAFTTCHWNNAGTTFVCLFSGFFQLLTLSVNSLTLASVAWATDTSFIQDSVILSSVNKTLFTWISIFLTT